MASVPLLLRSSAGLLAALLALTPNSRLWAIHAKNAGPQDVQILHKLPAPNPLSPEDALGTFKLTPGFKVELVAAEPLVETPVALSWDEKGRLFVCEMRGYMHDLDAAGEDQKIGRIVRLEDTDGDGKMDKRTVFADGLLMPRALLCVNGGLLVAEPPTLWFLKDTDGDGVADKREAIDSSYGIANGQPEHMANSPTWMLDNWIYSANHSKRYRFKDGKFLEEVAGRRGQWGLSQDNFGRIFYNTNSDFLRGNLFSEALAARNPNHTASAGLGIQILKDQSTWPSHPTPGVNRGYEPKQLRPDGTLATCTATCGAGVYRGNLFAPDFQGNVFIPEPAGNLVKRVVLTEQNGLLTAHNPEEGTEFWTSTDERFRPVNAYTGPDGSLYVVDMYRGVIQHTSFLTHYLVANIRERKLETPINMGRIWRVVPDGAKPSAPALPEESSKLVACLAHANGWVRDTAQRLLVERKDASIAGALSELATKGDSALGRLHALWTLEGIGAITPELITSVLKDSDEKVRATAVRLAPRPMLAQLAELVQDPSTQVRIALGFQLGSFPETQPAAFALARSAGNEPLVRDALLSGLRGRELETLQALFEADPATAPKPFVESLARCVLNERRKERVKKLLELAAAQPKDSALLGALLTGASGKASAGSKPGPAPKLLYLDSAPAELAKLAQEATPANLPLVQALDARLAWLGKPGVPPPPVVVPLTDKETALFDAGKTVYNTLCVGCHQPNGAGMEGLAPALANSEWVTGDPAVLPRILLHGLAGPITVGNQSWNLEMPPLGAALNNEQIAGVLTYIRREWEHTASPVSVDFVAKVRKDHSARSKSWTGEELKALVAPKKKTEPAEKTAAPAKKTKGATAKEN